ncbi:MAG: hypothetical protein CL862_01780 [Cyanobium sp. NAT70]|nr:hypothetical protein [Cyanobium sp. NAT70]
MEAAPAEAVPAEVVSVIYLDGTEAPSVTAPPEVAPEVPPADGDATVAFRDTLADNWLNLFLYQSVTAEDRREIQRVLAESGKAGVDAVYAAYQVVVDSGCHDQSMKLLHTHVGNYVATFGMEGLCRALPPLVPEDLPPDAAAAAPQIEEIIFEGTRYVPLTVSSRAVVTGLEQKPHLNGRAGKVTKIGSDGVAIFQMDATDHDESMRKIKIRVEHLQAISSAA